MRKPCVIEFLSLGVLSVFLHAGSASSWIPLRAPGAWERSGAAALSKYDGFLWYRAFVRVPKEFAGEDSVLELGAVDDADETFVNGRRVGRTGRMPPRYKGASGRLRRYKVPAPLVRFGDWNLIAVRVYDAGGWGGLTGGGRLRWRFARGEIDLAEELRRLRVLYELVAATLYGVRPG